MTKKERKALGRIQNLVGKAKSCYQNDRDPDRAEHVIVPLEKAFEECIRMLSKYPPEDLE